MLIAFPHCMLIALPHCMQVSDWMAIWLMLMTSLIAC